MIPFLPLGREIVVLLDRNTQFQFIGQDVSPETNFAQVVVVTPHEALDFAERAGFPDHAIIVLDCNDGQSVSELGWFKGVVIATELERAVETTVARGAAFVETVMRAHFNPGRMRTIERATEDLIRGLKAAVRHAHAGGFDATQRIAGLPCEWCADPMYDPFCGVDMCWMWPSRGTAGHRSLVGRSWPVRRVQPMTRCRYARFSYGCRARGSPPVTCASSAGIRANIKSKSTYTEPDTGSRLAMY